ncbi:MAG: CBS domain-containing protein [Bacteroidales bacterium]|nr:CBS domain-containing protein [Bacteroidales bacterium]
MLENRANQFLERYREIEEWVADNLNVQDMKELEQMPRYHNIRSNLAFCRTLRNLLSHRDWSKGGQDLVVVTDAALKQVNTLYYTLNPQTLMRLAIPKSRIFAPSWTDSVLSAMRVMTRNDYSYVPVMDGFSVEGVFSAKVVMRYLADGSGNAISEDLTFQDLRPYLSEQQGEWRKYDFLSADATLEDASRMFQASRDRRHRPDVLFITDDGRQNGKLLAMITPQDIVGV